MSIVSHQVESTDSTTSTTTATTTAKSATAAMEEGGEAGGKSDFDDKIHTVDTPGSTSSAAPVAAFQGSFIRNQLGHVPPPPSRPTKLTSARQWRCYFAAGWRDPHHWKAAFVEFVASTSLTLTSAFIDVTIGNFNTPQIPAYVGVTNIVLLTLFIMAAAPGSGGHINPLISYSTLLTGLSGFSRGETPLPPSTLPPLPSHMVTPSNPLHGRANRRRRPSGRYPPGDIRPHALDRVPRRRLLPGPGHGDGGPGITGRDIFVVHLALPRLRGSAGPATGQIVRTPRGPSGRGSVLGLDQFRHRRSRARVHGRVDEPGQMFRVRYYAERLRVPVDLVDGACVGWHLACPHVLCRAAVSFAEQGSAEIEIRAGMESGEKIGFRAVWDPTVVLYERGRMLHTIKRFASIGAQEEKVILGKANFIWIIRLEAKSTGNKNRRRNCITAPQ